MTLDAVGPWPPIQETHVEMDGAWALYEAWVKIQPGELDTALVYGYGKSSPGPICRGAARQLDPYHVAPLWPDRSPRRPAGPGLPRRGHFTEEQMAEVAAAAARRPRQPPRPARVGPLGGGRSSPRSRSSTRCARATARRSPTAPRP